MVLEWLSGDGGSVEELIARKKYKKAIDLLRTEFQKGSREPRLRHQLADVLVLAGRGREAVPILAGLADELARTGFAAKAIAVLKRIDKIDPGRADVARKLAALIEAKPQAPARAEAPQDFREIGISLPPRAPNTPLPTWPPPPDARTEEEPALPGPPLPIAPVPVPAPPRGGTRGHPGRARDHRRPRSFPRDPGADRSRHRRRREEPALLRFLERRAARGDRGVAPADLLARRHRHHRGRARHQPVRAHHGSREGLRAQPRGAPRPGAGDGGGRVLRGDLAARGAGRAPPPSPPRRGWSCSSSTAPPSTR